MEVCEICYGSGEEDYDDCGNLIGGWPGLCSSISMIIGSMGTW